MYVCGSWEPEKIKLEKKNKKLKTILTEMAKKIDDIAAMLNRFPALRAGRALMRPLRHCETECSQAAYSSAPPFPQMC